MMITSALLYVFFPVPFFRVPFLSEEPLASALFCEGEMEWREGGTEQTGFDLMLKSQYFTFYFKHNKDDSY